MITELLFTKYFQLIKNAFILKTLSLYSVLNGQKMSNSICVAGIVGKDFELKTINNEPAGSFSLADSQGKNKETIWFSCQVWGKRAEILSSMIKKGGKVTVFGSLSTYEWKDKDGNIKTSLNIRVNDVSLQGEKQITNEDSHVVNKKPIKKSDPDFENEDIPF